MHALDDQLHQHAEVFIYSAVRADLDYRSKDYQYVEIQMHHRLKRDVFRGKAFTDYLLLWRKDHKEHLKIDGYEHEGLRQIPFVCDIRYETIRFHLEELYDEKVEIGHQAYDGA